MVTICPRQSTTARKVRLNAAEAIGSGRPSSIRSTSGRSWPTPVLPDCLTHYPPGMICTAGSTRGNRSNAESFAAHRQRNAPQDEVDILGDAPGGDQDEPVDQLRELVGELHRHSATERMTHYGYPLDVEHAEQVAHPVGVRRDRVVGARLVGFTVAQ